MNHSRRNRLLAKTTMILGSLVVMMLLSSSSAQSQYRQWVDTTLPKVVKPYGVGASEFLLGSYKYFYTKDRPVTELWDYYNSIGISTVLLCASDHYRSQFDSFLLATNRPQNGRVLVADAWKVIQATSAREIEFYPFDSSQSRKWGYNECVALSYDDDVTQLNEEYDPMLREAIYDVSDAGTLALGDIAYNYQPYQFSSFRQVEAGSGWRTVHPDSLINRYQLSLDTIGKTYYIALTGHLFSTGKADDTSRMFRIEIWNEINKGRPYFPAGDSVMRAATDNLSLLYHTLYVRKSDLLPAGPPPLNWNQYRTVSLPIDLHGDTGRMSGPLRQDHDTSRRFNLKVYYEGEEKVALRSVGIRESIAEMMMGTRAESVGYRDSLLSHLNTLLRNTDGSLRSQIITVYGKDEPWPSPEKVEKEIRGYFTNIRRHYPWDNNAGRLPKSLSSKHFVCLMKPRKHDDRSLMTSASLSRRLTDGARNPEPILTRPSVAMATAPQSKNNCGSCNARSNHSSVNGRF